MTTDNLSVSINPFYIQGVSGKNFALELIPINNLNPSKAVLYFPPFAEEMNKTRRMAAMQARSLASKGIRVLQVDLYGTGDSEGDFSDADWDIWSEDMKSAANWLKEKNIENIVFLGCRLGAMLALYTASQIDRNVDFVFWQPVINGELFMTQFMRLKLASDMMNTKGKKTIKELRSILQEGNTIEVAGYSLPPNLVHKIDQLSLAQLLPGKDSTVHWIEITSTLEKPVSPVNKKIIDSWITSGINLNIEQIVGENFWTTPEISEIPALIEKTTRIIYGS